MRGLIFFCLLFASSLHAQIYFGPEIFISNGTSDGGWLVITADLDQDGDLDVISSSGNDNKVAWYENLDGHGNFSDQKIITDSAIYVNHILATDIDGDGDLDVVYACSLWNEIAWYENIDGQGNFGGKNFISISLLCPGCIASGDIDMDGDIDIVVASRNDGRVSLLENIDGAGTFAIPNVLAEDIEGAFWVDLTDMENDGDLDIISSAYWGDKIYWHENIDGQGVFADPVIITELVDDPQAAIAVDLDNDGDPDVLSVSQVDSKVARYMNIDGQGTFGPQILISDDVWGADCIYAADLDNDGDPDAVVGSMHDDNVVWFENNGDGEFGSLKIIAENTDFVTSVHAADLDGDGDVDVLSANHNDDNISWYQNISLIITENPQNQVVCPGFNAYFSVTANDAFNYQWQVNEGNGFFGLGNDNIYSGVNSDMLYVSITNIEMTGFEYRCLLSNDQDSLFSDIALLSVEDNEPPLILSEHNDISLIANDHCEFVLPDYRIEAIIVDNCDTMPSIEQAPPPGTLLTGPLNNISLTVADYMQNSAVVNFNLEVIDNSPPMINSDHPDQILDADGNCLAILPDYVPEVDAHDNCSFEIIQEPVAGSVISGEINEVTLSVVDGSENISRVFFNVEVVDKLAPEFSCVDDLSIELTEGLTSYLITGTGFDPLEKSDNCQILNLVNDYNYLETLEGASFSIGTSRVVWELEDAASNKTTCDLEVTIIPYQGIDLYPNPTPGLVYINFYRTDVEKISVFNSNGKFIFEKPIRTQKETIDLSYLESGLYSILIQTAGEVFIYKLVKIQ